MEKKIYVITEYGVCDEHYHVTKAYGSEEEANKAWEIVREDMRIEAEAHELKLDEWSRGDWKEAEYYDEEDTLGNFHRATLESMTINV